MKIVYSLIGIFILAYTAIAPTGAQTISSDGSNSSSNSYILYDDFNFRTTQQDGVVYMDWKPFTKDADFKYYKVIRSTKNSDPTYPNDGYLTYSTNKDFVEFTDKNPPKGGSYYRVCAITADNVQYCSKVQKVIYEEYTVTGSNCSFWPPLSKPEAGCYYTTIYKDGCPIDTLVCKEDTTEKKVCTMEYAPVCGLSPAGTYETYSNKCMLEGASAYYKYSGECTTEIEKPSICPVYSLTEPKEGCKYVETKRDDGCSVPKLVCDSSENAVQTPKTINTYGLSITLRNKSQKVIDNFIKSMESRGYENEKMVEKIDQVTTKLNALEKQKPKLSNLINYLIELLQQKRENYVDDFTDIESIFNVF